MAVVGEAKIVVTAVTKGVEGEIRRAFSSAATGVAEKEARNSGKKLGNALFRGMDLGGGKSNVFTNMADDIKKLYPEADKAANAFSKLVRSGFVAQGGIGALVGSVGSLVGGLGALVGAAGGAAGALAGVAGAAVTLKVGLAVGKLALGGISQAVSAATKTNGGYSKSLKEMKFDAEEAALGVERAGLNLEKAREGLARVSDLAPSNRTRREAMLAVREAELALRKAKDAEQNPDKDKKAGSDPFANLTPAQKDFAKYLLTLQKDFRDLKEAAAKGFLPLLQTQMERLIKGGLLTILKERFYDIGRGLGLATQKFTDIFLSGSNMKRFNAVLGQIADTLPSFGTILGNVFSGLLSILKAADPLTRRFVAFLEAKTGSFAKFLDIGENTGALTKFFNKAGDLASKFGKFFGQTFSGLGNIIEANFSPGSGGYIILDWLDKLSAGWKNADILGLQNYFKGAATNFVAMGNALGGAIETIIKSGSNPAIAEFWRALDGGSYAFSQIVTGAVESAPALGRLVQTLAEIVAVFADSSQVTAFFDTLNYFAQGLSEALNAVKPVIDFIGGTILGPLSAVTLMIAAFSKVSIVALGYIGKMANAMGIAMPAALSKYTAAKRGADAIDRTSLATKKAEAVAIATSSLQLKRQALEAKLHAATMQMSSVSVGAVTTGQKVLAVSTNLTTIAITKSQLAFNTASIAAKAFGASMKVAMASNPIGWIVLIVGALVELGIALAGIHGDNMQRAVDGVSASMEKGANSADVWKNALLAVPDAFKNSSDSVEAFKEDLSSLKSAQEMGGWALLFSTAGTTGVADAFGAMGRSLSNVATTDLPRAQRQMKAFAEGQKMTTREVAVAIDEMDEYKTELKKQADQMGINIGNTDTLAGKLRLAEFAMGTGAVAARYQAEELAKFQQAAASSASEMVDFAAALKKSTKNGKVDAVALAKELKQQVADSTNYYKNLMILRQRGVSEAYIAQLQASGPEAAKSAAALVKLTDDELKKSGIVGANAGTNVVASMEAAIRKGTATGLLDSAYKELGEASMNAFYKAIEQGKGVDEALRILQADLYKKRMEIPAVLKMTPEAKAAFAREVGQAINFTVDPATGSKNGGYISAYKNGGLAGLVRRFANGSGGPVFGAGTARSDSIPAMLSNGEYVINARATAQNRDLLDAINSNKQVSMAPNINVTVNPSAGMDERALAAQVSRLIAFEIRKGNI
jgi:hypothetical protein